MKLIWFQRSDSRWNADCACGATLCGSAFAERGEFEAWHFQQADRYRLSGEKELPCGPKFPEEDLNMPGPLVFP